MVGSLTQFRTREMNYSSIQPIVWNKPRRPEPVGVSVESKSRTINADVKHVLWSTGKDSKESHFTEDTLVNKSQSVVEILRVTLVKIKNDQHPLVKVV